MDKFLSTLTAFVLAVSTFAQTPEEIISRMEAEMDKCANDGLGMVVDIKIPILGTMSTTCYSLGDKIRLDASMMGVDIITWSDGKTMWTYNSKTNTVEIADEDPKNPTSTEGDAEMLLGITEGYDVSLKKETDDAWYILCKKQKTNQDKDDPKTMDLVVSKRNYYPVSISAKMSGATMTMRNFSFNVTEHQVTFHPEDYPEATIKDKR